MDKKPHSVYMSITDFIGCVFSRKEGTERSDWVTKFALSLTRHDDEPFALELLDKAAQGMTQHDLRQARYREKKKKQNLEVLVNPTLPGTADGDAAAVTNKAGTAPAGQHFTPVPVSGTGDCPDGGLLTPWYGPATGEPFGGDAATREGAEAVISGFATSPSEFQNQKRPGKSADSSIPPMCCETHGGSERGDGGLPIPADQKGEGGLLTAPSPTPPLGILKNVRISPEQLRRYRAEYGDPTRLIDALSTYIAKTGKRYKNHFAALVSWARREIESGIDPETGSKADQLSRIRFAARAAGIDAFSGKRIDFATGEVIEPEAESPGEIPYNPLELGEAE